MDILIIIITFPFSTCISCIFVHFKNVFFCSFILTHHEYYMILCALAISAVSERSACLLVQSRRFVSAAS